MSGLKLLTMENAKTIKGVPLGYLTGILYLAPAFESGVINTCPMATEGCKAGCLYTAGLAGVFPKIQIARVNKTLWLARDRAGFIEQLRADIRAIVAKAGKIGMIPCIRVNGTSDLPQIAMQLASEFPTVQFYDYTKIPRPWQRTRANYHVTFSLSESNFQDAHDCLQHGLNVAVVFNVKRGHELPVSWRGFPVIDGDTHDLRFLDSHRLGLVIGLRAKGKAKKDVHGFVQIAKLG
jgi:hypothetical protein